MKIINGVMVFDDIYDLTYNILLTSGLDIDTNNYIFDQDNKNILQFQGRKIKTSVNPNSSCYAGQGEITFDILDNVRLVTTLLGYCIDKETATNGFSCLSHFIEERQMDDYIKPTSLSLKMSDYSVRSTNFYYNKCLKYIHAIFLVYEYNVDLSNFDSIEN